MVALFNKIIAMFNSDIKGSNQGFAVPFLLLYYKYISRLGLFDKYK